MSTIFFFIVMVFFLSKLYFYWFYNNDHNGLFVILFFSGHIHGNTSNAVYACPDLRTPCRYTTHNIM